MRSFRGRGSLLPHVRLGPAGQREEDLCIERVVGKYGHEVEFLEGKLP
jgi:hypothetical protein